MAENWQYTKVKVNSSYCKIRMHTNICTCTTSIVFMNILPPDSWHLKTQSFLIFCFSHLKVGQVEQLKMSNSMWIWLFTLAVIQKLWWSVSHGRQTDLIWATFCCGVNILPHTETKERERERVLKLSPITPSYLLKSVKLSCFYFTGVVKFACGKHKSLCGNI